VEIIILAYVSRAEKPNLKMKKPTAIEDIVKVTIFVMKFNSSN
jgi:hypothetical protein